MRNFLVRWAALTAAAIMFTASTGVKAFALEADTMSSFPSIRMDVSQIGQNTASLAVGQSHIWIVRSQIPEDIAGAQQYAVIQTLDPGLTMEEGSLEVCLLPGEEERVPMKMEEHYTFVTGTITEGDTLAERMSISLTPAGTAWVSEQLDSRGRDPQLQITYRAWINEKASVGTQIIGSAQLSYTDRNGSFCRTYSDKPSVYTGGLHLLLTDTQNRPLPGGTFMLARSAEKAEREGQPLVAELLDTGAEQAAVVYESFYTTETLEGEKQAQVTTGPDGTAVIYGLPFGEYYLVQTAAPKGMQMRGTPLLVCINEISHLTISDGWKNGGGQYADHTVHILNEGISIPSTGGSGTTAITAAGTAVLLSAILLMLSNHRKGYR